MKDTSAENETLDNHVDDHVDKKIQDCLSCNPPQSFFVFAGAGSGKTRSLINTLEYIAQTQGAQLTLHAKQVAVITYTNAACDEIERRLRYNPIFQVSTIHSFLWELIKHFQNDIRKWLCNSIDAEIEELIEKQQRGRGGKTAESRKEKITKLKERKQKIQTVLHFSYNPNGDNWGQGSIKHSEVVGMGAEFIATEITMQKILTSKYPILLIDEAQDTKKELVDAFLAVYETNKTHWTIGMFGDVMQKIYMDGKDQLPAVIPHDWAQPCKVMNHRSAKRIVELANAIRSSVDRKQQRARSDALTGTVRLFIVASFVQMDTIEASVAMSMEKIASDLGWSTSAEYKILILEHHMAAKRLGFCNIFGPLNESKAFDTSLRDGSITEFSVLANIVLPLKKAYIERDFFGISKIVRQYSPLLSKSLLQDATPQPQKHLAMVETATNKLLSLWNNDRDPSCLDVLQCIHDTRLFEVGPEIDDILENKYSIEDIKSSALKKAFEANFSEFERYFAYVTNKTCFSTHQGVKGLEFPRVMVILDDSLARGNWFSYEKLFEVKPLSEADLKNISDGKDSSISRTKRLFYVACTRARQSLAVVVYTQKPSQVRQFALINQWFHEEEIIFL